MFNPVTGYIRSSVVVGALLGAGLSVYMYTHVQWYHDYLVWSWSNAWLWALGLPVGVAVALLND